MGTKSFSEKEWEADHPTKESRIALVLAKICSIKEVGIIPWKKEKSISYWYRRCILAYIPYQP